jgi:peptidoglycan/xylan/chitin deacetylase (PgdA/CDA1 family)
MKDILKNKIVNSKTCRDIFQIFNQKLDRVLMYHRFSAQPENRKVSIKTFEEQLEYISKDFNVISLNEYIDKKKSGISLKDEVVITIDDGYTDFFEYAYPLLRKYRFPATLFIASDFLEKKNWLWWDEIEYILKKTHKDKIIFQYQNNSFNIEKQKGIDKPWNEIADACLELGEADRKELLNHLTKSLDVNLPQIPQKEYSAITIKQAKKMMNNGISIGCHTKTHPVLKSLRPEDLEKEIIYSKNRLEKILQTEINFFCYPYGRSNDVNDKITVVLQKAKFKGAVVAYSDSKFKPFNKFAICRHGIGNNLNEFLWKVYGGEQLLTKLKNMSNFVF